jgi:hypothetical protein
MGISSDPESGDAVRAAAAESGHLDLTPEPAELITPELPVGEVWERLAVLYTAVARAVTRKRADAECPVVVTCGDCLTVRNSATRSASAGRTAGTQRPWPYSA